MALPRRRNSGRLARGEGSTYPPENHPVPERRGAVDRARPPALRHRRPGTTRSWGHGRCSLSTVGTEKAPADLVVVKIDDVTFDEVLHQQWPFRRITPTRGPDRSDRRGQAKGDRLRRPVQRDEHDPRTTGLTRARSATRRQGRPRDDGGEGNGRSQLSSAAGGILKGSRARRSATPCCPTIRRRSCRRVPYKVGGHDKTSPSRRPSAGDRTGRSTRDRSTGATPGSTPRARRAPCGGLLRRRRRREGARGSFRDKIVVVGASAPSCRTSTPTSLAGEGCPGRRSRPTRSTRCCAASRCRLAPGGCRRCLIVAARRSSPRSLGAAPAPVRGRSLSRSPPAVAATSVAAQLAFNDGAILPFVYPLVRARARRPSARSPSHYSTDRVRARARRATSFSRFVPEAVVDQVLARTDDDLRLGGEQRDGTVMFTDLRGFTSFSERCRRTR